MKVFRYIASSILLTACASCADVGYQSYTSDSQRTQSTEDCSKSALGTVLSFSSWGEGVWGHVNWVGPSPMPARAYMRTITGRCASQVVNGTSAGLIGLASGALFSVLEDGTTRPNPLRSDPFPMPVIGVPAPSLVGGRFLSADQVSGVSPGEAGQTDYIGLWSGSRGYTLAAFSVVNGVGAGAAKPLATSREEIRGVIYLPSPDTQDGSVSFVQVDRHQTVRLISFFWDHGFFPSLTSDDLVTRVSPAD